MSIKLLVSAVVATAAIMTTLSYLGRQPSSHFDDLSAFRKFKSEYKKSYASPSETDFRFGVFQKNLQTIKSHTNPSYSLGINQFADLTFEEFSNQYLMSNLAQLSAVQGVNKCNASADTHNRQDGNAVDWVSKGKVQKVKNQAQCGSCWAFSTVGALESAYSISGRSMPDLSEQELVDCAGGDYGNLGCNGGLMPWAFSYILDNGVHTETEYPYKGLAGTCHAKSLDNPQYGIAGCSMVGANTTALTEALRSQPVSVAFHVGTDFQMYKGGVYDPYFCFGSPNHAVLAVGFDLDASTPFYKVKNSWSEQWGEQGFFRIAIRSGKGTCKIAGSGMSVVPVV